MTALMAQAVFLTAWLNAAEVRVPQIEQHGITWTFEKPVQAGQFVNGDWWVVGPVTVADITRPNGQPDRDGSMINPMPSMTVHAYDSRIPVYVPDLNVANKLPKLMLSRGDSLVSTISGPLPRPVLDVAAVLTVVAAPPPAGSFRPPYAGRAKPLHNAAKLRPDLLPALDPVADTPPLAQVERLFEKPWIDHRLEWQGDPLHPKQNMCNYGGGMARDTSIGLLRLMVNDVTPEAKRTLMVRYVQLGIDNYGLVANGAAWGHIGGSLGVGRKLPILAAGVLLDDTPMKRVAFDFDTVSTFLEDGQTFLLTQEARDATQGKINRPGSEEYWHPGWYDEVPLGTPVWGERYCGWRHNPKGTVMPGKIAYQGITYHSTLGTALAVRLMGIEALWNHDPFLAWIDDRWAAKQQGTWGSVFAQNMYAAYRNPTPHTVAAPTKQKGTAP